MEIKLYLTPSNPWCKQLRTFLKRKRVSFEILDLDESDNARDEMLQKSNQMAIPVLDIDGEIIVGFHPEKIEAALKRAKEI